MDERLETLERDVAEVKRWIGILLELSQSHAALLAGKREEALQHADHANRLMGESAARNEQDLGA